MKYLINIFLLPLLLASVSYAACENHNGINCSNMSSNGGVYCRDGTRDETQQFIDTLICMNNLVCTTAELNQVLNTTNYNQVFEDNKNLDNQLKDLLKQFDNIPQDISSKINRSGGIVNSDQYSSQVYSEQIQMQTKIHQVNDLYKQKFAELTDLYDISKQRCNEAKKLLILNQYQKILNYKKSARNYYKLTPSSPPKYLSPIDDTKPDSSSNSFIKTIEETKDVVATPTEVKVEPSLVKKLWQKILNWFFPVKEEVATNLNDSDLVKKYKNSVVYLECYFDNEDGVQGSGTLETIAGTNRATITTNAHIVKSKKTGSGPIYCNATFPGQGTVRIDNNNIGDMQNPYTENLKKQGEFFHLSKYADKDFAMIDIPKPSKETLNTVTPDTCDVKPDLGDKVLILGYPTIGSNNSVTVTEGIISGYEGDYYVTDAKISPGNSGGLALLEKKGCYLGIPTFTVTGPVETLGRILNINVVIHPQK